MNWYSVAFGFCLFPAVGAVVCVAVWRYDLWRASQRNGGAD